MPRIGGGGGGGPVIPPQGPGQTQQSQKSEFTPKVTSNPPAGTDAARFEASKAQAQSELSGKVRELAKRLANGSLTQKEATREFVSLVIEERFPHFKRKKKQKKNDGEESSGDETETAEDRLEEAVTELIERDPAIAKKLSSQFKKLAKG